ncbi:MAG: hypothetical protein QOJ81_746 [Chloroflexota bacterium]|jgi:hypothetical protein|nr:hypothetical protein [Chloroflexota bacterium]
MSKVGQKRLPPAISQDNIERPSLARINTQAALGRAGFQVGDRVKIESTGLHAGQIGVVQRLSGGVIPSALVQVESGGARQVRTIDLVPAPKTEGR